MNFFLKHKPWLLWTLPLFFFAYQFIVRLFPGLILQDLMLKYHIDATDLGLLSSMYYFSYAGMQIPVALLLDHWGARRTISLSALVCSIASLLFVSSSSWTLVLFSRFLMGMGSAVGFLGCSKVISTVFPESKYAKMVGLTFSFGLLGAVYGGKPVSSLIDSYGWENTGMVIAFLGLLCSALVFLFVRIPKVVTKKEESAAFTASLKRIFKNKPLLLLALANLLMVGSLEGFADIWGVSFLMKAFFLSKPDAALLVSFIFVGMLFGGPFLAWCSRFSSYFMVSALSGVFMTLLFTLLLSGFPNLHYYLMVGMFFLVGIFCCYQVLVFTIASQLVKSEDKGICIALLNSVNMIGGSFFHLLIGSILDKSWTGDLVDGIKDYSANDYAWSLSAIPVCALLGALLILFLQKYRSSSS